MFNERLRKLRKDAGLTQKEIADRIGVSDRVYAYYETDRFPRDEKIIKKLTECFDCTTDYLLGISEFRNYEEMKNIHENIDLFKQIEDPELLEDIKNIFITLIDINKNMEENSHTAINCLNTVVDSIYEIFSSYRIIIEESESLVPKDLHNLKFLEFKAFSTERIDAVNASIKTLASELANKIKINLNNDDTTL